MGDNIASDVSMRILELCDEQTLCSAHGECPRIELHEPFRDERVTVRHGIPFVAVLERAADGTETVETVGHFDYAGTCDGLPGMHSLLANYGPLDHFNQLSADERQFVKDLIHNQYRPSGPVSGETDDWSATVFTGSHLVGEVDEDEFWRTADAIYPSDNLLGTTDTDVDFDESRRDELVRGTIEALREFAVDIAGVSADGTYAVRGVCLHDIRDRAETIYTGSPPVTQTQAVSWALHEIGLSQTHIGTLRRKTQPTIRNHLKRAATHYVSAEMTMDAFGDLPRYMPHDIIGDVGMEHAAHAADERFRFEKSLVDIRAKCPECGLDAGAWDGGTHGGDWVDEPTKFWQGEKIIDGRQAPSDPRHVECPECSHDAPRSRFESAWEDEHGTVDYDGPEPF